MRKQMSLSPLFGWTRPGPDRRRHYNPEEPRDQQGRWTTGSGGASSQGYVVKSLVPGIGPASEWREGPPILGDGKPPLEPGTAIATFKDGRYPNNFTGNHAAIFLEYGEKDGKRGIWVLDQSKDRSPARTFKPFGGRAEHYSVIKRR